jgi:hypothetical protein
MWGVDYLDILFIDGDHSAAGMMQDFRLYSPLVKEGGFIILDDYLDWLHSAGVMDGVHALGLSGEINVNDYTIFGTNDNAVVGATSGSVNDWTQLLSNDFVLQKKVKGDRKKYSLLGNKHFLG